MSLLAHACNRKKPLGDLLQSTSELELVFDTDECNQATFCGPTRAGNCWCFTTRSGTCQVGSTRGKPVGFTLRASLPSSCTKLTVESRTCLGECYSFSWKPGLSASAAASHVHPVEDCSCAGSVLGVHNFRCRLRWTT